MDRSLRGGLRYVVSDEPVQLLVQKRGELGEIVVDIPRVQREDRMTVWYHARLNHDGTREEPLLQVIGLENL
jgi:hypothetical protein